MTQSRRTTIGELGELGFLERLVPTLEPGPGLAVGPGDDCAVITSGRQQLLLTTDALVDGVHFRPEWMTPRQIGRKAYLVNASDIAAMGGQPRWCLVSVGAPAEYPAADLRAIHRGLAAAAAETGASVAGGNLTRASVLFVSVAVVGAAPARPLRRTGACPGDQLYVTGSLGAAALGLHMLQRGDRARGAPVRRFREPQPRVSAGSVLAANGVASAMIDVSDGLLQDLAHLCAASTVGARIEIHRLPIPPRVRREGYALALSGGEDYELLCAVPMRNVGRVERLKAKLGCHMTRIGECVAVRDGIRVVDERGEPVSVARSGFDHFTRETSYEP